MLTPLHTEQPKSQTEDERMAIVWRDMSPLHRQFVIERLTCRTDAEACRRLGISQGALSNSPMKKLIDEYIIYQQRNALAAARQVLVESTLEAVGALRKRLKGRQGLTAAKEILDRAGLPTISRQEIGGVNGGPIEVKAVDYRTGIAEVAPRSISDSDASGEE